MMHEAHCQDPGCARRRASTAPCARAVRGCAAPSPPRPSYKSSTAFPIAYRDQLSNGSSTCAVPSSRPRRGASSRRSAYSPALALHHSARLSLLALGLLRALLPPREPHRAPRRQGTSPGLFSEVDAPAGPPRLDTACLRSSDGQHPFYPSICPCHTSLRLAPPLRSRRTWSSCTPCPTTAARRSPAA